MIQTPCVLFAGGKSSRMGEDKSLLPFGDSTTLTHYQYAKLSKIFSNVYIATKNPEKFDFKANFLQDLDIFKDTFAPTAAFITAFEILGCEEIFVLSVDTPFVSQKIIETLLKEDSKNHDATIAKSPNSIESMCGIYHRSMLQEFWSMFHQNNHKLNALLERVKTHYVAFDDVAAFTNLNHPDDYQKALLLLKH